jgi:hypothetical protein
VVQVELAQRLQLMDQQQLLLAEAVAVLMHQEKV